MKVVAGRIVFDKAIDIVSHAVPTKDFGDATSGILLEVTKNKPKELTLMANSLDVFIKTKMPLSEAAKPGVVVPAGKILKNVVGSLKSFKNPIEMEYDEDENLFNVKCGKDYQGSIAHYDSVGFVIPASDDEIKELPKMSIPVRLIKKALNEVAFACGKDKNHLYMTGMFFDQTKNGMNIVGSDAFRMSIIRFKSKIQSPKKVVMPINFLELFKKLLVAAEIDDAAIVSFYIDSENNMAYFVSDTIVFGFQTYGQDYISDGYEKLLVSPEDCAVRLRVNRELFLSKLDLAVAHNFSSQDTILFNVKNKRRGSLKSKIGANAANVNSFDVPFAIDKIVFNDKEKPVNAGVNPSFFYDVLNKMSDKEIEIGFVDLNSGPIVIYSVLDNNINGDYIHMFSIE